MFRCPITYTRNGALKLFNAPYESISTLDTPMASIFQLQCPSVPRMIKRNRRNPCFVAQSQAQTKIDIDDVQTSGSESLNRREIAKRLLLTTSTAIAAGCQLFPSPAFADSAPEAPGRVREARMVMRVTALRGSVPQQWVADFQTGMEGFGIVALTPRPQLKDIWDDLLGTKGGKPTTADAVTLGDSWLQTAIVKGLIQPIPQAREHRFWAQLPLQWRQLVTRSPESGLPDINGEVYASPYRWGATLVLYRTDKAARWKSRASTRSGKKVGMAAAAPFTDWDDLLLPQLKGRVGFIDSPREFVGVALKTLGLGFNATVADMHACGISEAALAERIRRLAGQVKVFSNNDHVRALSAGEVDVVVGWSDDVMPLAQRMSNAKLVAPASGLALWSDMWCVPRTAAGGASNGEPSALLPAWLELPLQPVRVRKTQGLRGGASPLLLPQTTSSSRSSAKACAPVRAPLEESSAISELAAGVMPSEQVLERSEFLLPLDASTAAMYKRVLGVR